VATAFESFYWLPDPPGSAALGYYVQDMETLFFAQNTVEFARASKTYTLRPDVVRVTKSNWNRAEVIGIGGHAPAVVGPSIDMDIFYPRNDDGIDPNRSLHIVAMVRPETPRRAPARTLRILRRLKDTFGSRVSIGCFGASLEAIKALGISLDGIRIDGALPPGNVAELLGRTDIFLDFSDWQAMGLTALEAMASGAAIIVPRRGGAPEFCRDGEAGLVVDTRDEDACFAAAERLVTDAQMRLSLRHNGMNVAAAFLPELAALKLLDALWGEE